jgi:hypothetical protein
MGELDGGWECSRYQEEDVREVVMAMCVRGVGAFVITFCGSSPPPFLSFLGFWS